MKKTKKKVLKGKNKFIRLDDENLKFIIAHSKQLERSQNYTINLSIKEKRERHGSNGR